MNILGVNAFHADSSAAIICNGKLVAAAEEERFRRIKHWAGFPSQAIAYCLQEAKLSLGDIDAIAINQDSRANFGAKLGYMMTSLPRPQLIIDRLFTRGRKQNIEELFEANFPKQKFSGKIVNVEHHLAHLFSAYYVSPFQDAAVVSVDGFGDFASTVWGEGHNGDVNLTDRILFPHSLGQFYQALTQYLGFPHYGDEYKVMGLAPYGAPTLQEPMEKILRLLPNGRFELDLKYFMHHREGNSYQWVGGEPKFNDLFSPELEKLLGPKRRPEEPITEHHKNIAHSVQVRYEDAFFHLLNSMQRGRNLTSIALAGGCAANSVANGKIRRRTSFKNVYVQPAPGDAGGAIGAAFVVWQRSGGSRCFKMDHAYWGPEYSALEIDALISRERQALLDANCIVTKTQSESDLCKKGAAAVADGKVVGWFQGRMEWGPRALGNRSIVCDPRRGDMKAVLNAKIKRRESFRPFAPSVLSEHVSDWFEEDDEVPFMMQVFQIKEDKRRLIPAVTHMDGSGRLQTVKSDANPLYHQLIDSFRELTGIPMVLNTSFNENEPVVCQPEEALNCFLRTNMDVLVLGSNIISR